jgi:Antirestriction protein
MQHLHRKPTTICRQLVPRQGQLAVTEQIFGVPFRLEMVARGFVMTLTREYRVSGWQFFTLDNGGCYVAPVPDKTYRVCGLTRPLTSDAVGQLSSLLSLSYLCFSMDLRFADRCDAAYSHLREFIHQRPESPAILAIAS